MSPIKSLGSAALFAAVAFVLSGCGTYSPSTALATSASEAKAASPLVPFASDEGLARLGRSGAKAGFALLVNQFEAQYNDAFCGPTSAAIVLNAVYNRSADLPRDHTRLRKEDVQFMSAGEDPIISRFTQDNVMDKSPKTRAQVLGEPVTIGGKQMQDWGFQLRQLDSLLRANGLVTQLVVVDDALSAQSVRAELADSLTHSGTYVLVNYRRKAVGQKGGGHISPLAAYDAASDSFLLLDVNPAAAGWVWIDAATLVTAMRTFDTVENRGYVLIRAP
jgi:hypothetical protein